MEADKEQRLEVAEHNARQWKHMYEKTLRKCIALCRALQREPEDVQKRIHSAFKEELQQCQ